MKGMFEWKLFKFFSQNSLQKKKERRILKIRENKKDCISNSYLYNLRNVPLPLKGKSAVVQSEAAVHNKFISTDAREIRSLRE